MLSVMQRVSPRPMRAMPKSMSTGSLDVGVAQDQVARLDVTMNDFSRVSHGEELGHAHDEPHGLRHGHARSEQGASIAFRH